MSIAQADEIVLRPDTSEFVWTVVTITLLAAVIFVIVGSIIWVKRAAARRRELEERVDDLEKSSLEQPQI